MRRESRGKIGAEAGDISAGLRVMDVSWRPHVRSLKKRSIADDVDDTIRHMQHLELRLLPLSIRIFWAAAEQSGLDTRVPLLGSEDSATLHSESSDSPDIISQTKSERILVARTFRRGFCARESIGH